MHAVTLHAAFPDSLADEALAELVHACVAETAERHGFAAPEVRFAADHIELLADMPGPVLLAIAAEVRRATGRWHRSKFGTPLWHGE